MVRLLPTAPCAFRDAVSQYKIRVPIFLLSPAVARRNSPAAFNSGQYFGLIENNDVLTWACYKKLIFYNNLENYPMRFFSTFILLSALALSAISQAQQPPTADAQSGDATIYFYRYKQFVGSALTPSVYCDEGQLARMENGRFFIAHVGAGKHSFRSNDAQSGVDLDLKPGEKYFIRVEIATGMMKGHGRLVLTPVEQGSYELKSKQLKALDADKIVDKARVSADEPTAEPSGNK